MSYMHVVYEVNSEILILTMKLNLKTLKQWNLRKGNVEEIDRWVNDIWDVSAQRFTLALIIAIVSNRFDQFLFLVDQSHGVVTTSSQNQKQLWYPLR